MLLLLQGEDPACIDSIVQQKINTNHSNIVPIYRNKSFIISKTICCGLTGEEFRGFLSMLMYFYCAIETLNIILLTVVVRLLLWLQIVKVFELYIPKYFTCSVLYKRTISKHMYLCILCYTTVWCICVITTPNNINLNTYRTINV